MAPSTAKLARTDAASAPAGMETRPAYTDAYGTALVHAMRRLTVADLPHDDEHLGGLRAAVRRQWQHDDDRDLDSGSDDQRRRRGGQR